MDDIVDLEAIYSTRKVALPRISHVQDSDSTVCDASVGIRLKWEDDDIDEDSTTVFRRQPRKKRCPKENVRCRAPFVKPKTVRVKKVIGIDELADLVSDRYVCVTSLPVDVCTGHIPFVSQPEYRSRFEAFRNEVFGVEHVKAKTLGYIGIHLRRGDRCGKEFEKHANVYQMGACGEIQNWVAKIGEKARESNQLVYIATDSKEPHVIQTIKDAGFFTKQDLFGHFAGRVMFDEKELSDLDIFLIELDMLIYAHTSFVVSASNAVTEVVTTTREWLGISGVEVIA
jgi:hypothetical protein